MLALVGNAEENTGPVEVALVSDPIKRLAPMEGRDVSLRGVRKAQAVWLRLDAQ